MVFETKRKKLDQAFEIKITGNDQQIEKVQNAQNFLAYI